MKTKVLILVTLIPFLSCKNDLRNEVEKVEREEQKSATQKELKFRLYNSTEFDLKDITVGLPETVLTYESLEKEARTEWVNVQSAYHYGFIRFFDNKKRKYYIQPIDYVGEEPFEKGELDFIIKSIDTLDQNFELDFSYENN